MLSKVKTVFDRLNTNGNTGVFPPMLYDHLSRGEDNNSARPTGTDDVGTPETHLYTCSSCSQVYVARDKRSCGACGIDVERVE